MAGRISHPSLPPASPMDLNFGEIIRSKRKELGLSQEEAAGKAGISVMTYGRIERGTVDPKLEQVRRIFSVLGLRLGTIDEQVKEELSANDCLSRIEFYIGQLRKVLGR